MDLMRPEELEGTCRYRVGEVVENTAVTVDHTLVVSVIG